MLLRGYIDESYSNELFTLSCLKSDILTWRRFESGWKNVLSFINKKLKAQGRQQISRYHAADCSSRTSEFSGWTTEEQIALTQELLKVFKRNWVSVTSYTMPMKLFLQVFPEFTKDPMGECYAELLKWLMLEIADQVIHYPNHVRLKPIKFDSALLNTFNQVMADRTFGAQHMFSTIAPLSSDDCIPLQAADLIAYENFKEAERQTTGRPRRKTLELLLTMNGSFGGRSLTFSLDAIQTMRTIYDLSRSNTLDGKSHDEMVAITKATIAKIGI